MSVFSLDWILLVIACVHLTVCPYTKVEESFNLQAMHDLIYHQTNINEYDHLEFPGVVPRTFIGPIIITTVASPFIYLANVLQLSKIICQYIVRASLGMIVLLAFKKFKNSVVETFGESVGHWLTLVTATQFHLLFYCTRPLPNVMALPFVLLAVASWLQQKHGLFIGFSAFAILIFRSELCLLLGLMLLMDLWSQRLKISTLLKYSIPVTLFSIGLTVLLDSFFWSRLVWPEGEVFWYNTILNKSSHWGTSPFLWYFYSVIPRALGFSCLLIPLGLYADSRMRVLCFPVFGFLFLYSFLPHKELRFIIYTFPILNVIIARACAAIWQNSKKSRFKYFLCLLLVGHLFINCLMSSCLLYISHHNYPGAYALKKLHTLSDPNKNFTVHIDVFSAQNGISRFLQENQLWRYNKTENLISGGDIINSFHYLLLGGINDEIAATQNYKSTHVVISVIVGFKSLKLDLYIFPHLFVLLENKIFVLKKK